MTFPFNSPYEDLRTASSRRADMLENSARLARSFGTYQLTGSGEYVLDRHFEFGLTFLEEPIFTSGSALDSSSPDLQIDNIPRVYALTFDWVQDDNDFYTGAYVAFAVDLPDTFNDPGYVINVHMTWEGVAFKDVLRDVDAKLVD